MAYNNRTESKKLMIYRILNNRKELSANDVSYYLNLEKGFEGEMKYDAWIERFSEGWLILNDLLFEYNRSEFQIDSFVITRDTCYIFEIKNFEGDFYIEGNKWFSLAGTKISNPVHQLERTETLFRKIQQEIGINLTLRLYVIFINPEFHLFNAPMNLPIIYPTQLNRFKNDLKKESSQLLDNHTRYANKLLSLHREENPYKRIPNYEYEHLKKGTNCASCHCLDVGVSWRTLMCKKCGCIENLDAGVVRNIEEFALLFPDWKITTNVIFDWCGEMVSKKTIQRILSSHYKPMGNARSTYYVK